MLLCVLGQERLRKTPPAPGLSPVCPPVTVLVPVRDEEGSVEGLMRALLAQEYPNFEVIVIDDHSADRTREVLKPYEEKGDIRLLESDGEGKRAASLTGLAHARGVYVLTTDADCRPASSWIGSMVAVALNSGADMVIGPVRMEGNPLYALDYLSLQAVTAGSAAMGRPLMCSGANLLVREEVYREAETRMEPKESCGDDQFLLEALKSEGAVIAFAACRGAQVVTPAPASAADFLSQRARWTGKSGSYADTGMIAAAVVTLFTQVLLILSIALGVSQRGQWLHWVPVAVVNLAVLFPAARFFRQERLLLWFPLAQLLYPFYAVTVVARAFLPNRWKGRKL